MIFSETAISGAFIVELDKREDVRGFFARAWCEREFDARGINLHFPQANLAFTEHAGTLRGLHYQIMPHGEAKLIRCIAGAVYDVIVDVRPMSSTYKQWIGVELSAANRKSLFVPDGVAHGYLTLTDRTELFYLVSSFYAPEAERGIRYDDPEFRIQWPVEVRVISDKDRGFPDYQSRSDHLSLAHGGIV